MRRKEFAIKALVYFTFVACFLFVVFCVGYRIRHPEEDNSKAHSDERRAEQAQQQRPAVQQAHTEPDGVTSSQEQSYAAKWLEPTAILTILLVIGVGITNYIYYRQLQKMRETVSLVGEQRDAMESQLTTMEGQLIAMRSQEQAMRTELELGNRAYVTVEAGELGPLVIGHPIEANLLFKNTGTTPAYSFMVNTHIAVRDSPLPVPMPFQPGAGEHSKGILPPGGVFHAPYFSVDKLTDEVAQQIVLRKQRVYVWGVISYEDIFGNGRWTKFCLTQTSRRNSNASSLKPCTNNNEAN